MNATLEEMFEVAQAFVKREKAVEMYLDYSNNYLTVECFAAHHDITVDEANELLEYGCFLHE